MPRFAANLSMMFNEVPFLDRFQAAAEAGFKGVEYLFPYDFPAEEIAERLDRHSLTQALFNMPPGDWQAGDRGTAALPGREGEFEDSIGTALDYAKALGNTRLHAMCGLLPEGVRRDTAMETYVANLRKVCTAAAPLGITVVIEPINQRDMPGYFLSYSHDALEAIEEVGAENLAIQFDLYHCQIMEGDLAKRMERLLPHIGHMQIAGVPDRHEPDEGEVNYPYLFDRMDALGYDGWVGCEYRPKGETAAGLDWFRRATA
jgi:hydroxypyruvate isomerase